MWIDRVVGENPESANGFVIDSPSYARLQASTRDSGPKFDSGKVENVPRRAGVYEPPQQTTARVKVAS
jgi:hypothetical protein